MLGLFCLVAGTGAASAQAPQRPMPTLPLTQLDERGQAADLDNRTFSLTFAQPVPIKDLLILLVRGTSLSVVPDPAIAGAFIATLWGVSSANLLYLPIGDKLKVRHESEQLFLDIAMEGVISIQTGENPRVIRTKLLSFLEPKARAEAPRKAA